MTSYSLPLFPLPRFVLFPRTHAPLHVFEPRYVAMMEKVLNGDRKLAMAHLREGFEADYLGAPPIHRVVTVVRVLWDERLPNERFNMIVEGIERGVVMDESQPDPYRVARIRPVVETFGAADSSEAMELAHSCAEMAQAISRHLHGNERALNNLMNTHQHPGIVADVIANALVPDPYARQSLLSEERVLRRLQLVRVQLHALAKALKSRGVEITG